MTNSSDFGEDDRKDKPEEIGWLGALGYLGRRAEQIIELRQAIGRITGSVRDTLLDIANLLTGNPSVGRQAELERVVGNLQGLAKAADQASAGEPSGSTDIGGSRGAEVDLTGIKTAVEARRDSSNASAGQASGEGGLENLDGKRRRDSAKVKALSTLDAAMDAGADRAAAKNSDASAPRGDKPPASDAPVRKADRFKLAFANGDGKADPSLAASSDLSALAKRPDARPSAASLKLDHADATNADPVSKADSPIAGNSAIEPTKQDATKPRQDTVQSPDARRKSLAPGSP